MQELKVFLCEDSIEGVFTAVWEAFSRRLAPEQTALCVGEEDNYRLFAVYERITPEPEKAVRVIRTLKARLGAQVYLELCRALACEAKDKADAVYHTIAAAFAMKRPAYVMGDLARDCVRRVFELSREAGNEIMRFQQFLRFQELEGGVLFARIRPKDNVLTFLAPHFSDRLAQENFMIYDELRALLVLHPAGREWYLRSGEAVRAAEGAEKLYTQKEREYQELFKYFCHKIAIEERRNPSLQTQMLPLRFQEYMVDFAK